MPRRKKCPRCKEGHTVQRTRKRDGRKFEGCSEFPKCRHSASYGRTTIPGGWGIEDPHWDRDELQQEDLDLEPW